MKKITILTSQGGGGHISTSNALTSYLKKDYEINVANIFEDVVAPLDLVNTVTFGGMTGENFYDYFLVRKQFGFINAIHSIGKWYFRLRTKRTVNLVQTFLEKNKPDLLISVIPFVNGSIIKAAKKLNIPLIIIPTDLCSVTFIHDINNPKYKNFKMALTFADLKINEILKPAQIPTEQIHVTGLPLRPEFFTPKNLHAIKKEFNIQENKPVILMLMGAVGSQALFTFAQQLTKITVPCHLVICVGKSNEMIAKIKELNFPSHISYTLVGFTQKMADLMAVADLFITKSGTVSVCEAIYSNLPLLVDATTGVLAWEQFNHHFIKEHGFGDVITQPEDISILVNNLLSHPTLLQKMKHNLTIYEKKHGGDHIKHLISQLI